MVLPACAARTTTVPTPIRVTVLPLIVAGPETMEKDGIKPLLAVALRVNGAFP